MQSTSLGHSDGVGNGLRVQGISPAHADVVEVIVRGTLQDVKMALR